MVIFFVILLLIIFVITGAPLFLIIGGVSFCLFIFQAEVPLFSLVKTMFDSVNKPALLSVPLYIFAGAVMAKGEIANRLIQLAQVSVGWFRGGMGVAAILACMFFAAISGSSPVTLIAIGSIMYPALIRQKFMESTAIGVLTVSGSLGILIPPSIPMIVYSIVTGTDVNKLFIAGIIPGFFVAFLWMICTLFLEYGKESVVVPFKFSVFFVQLQKSVPALLMPVLVLGGIYSGVFNVTEAAAVAAVYAVLAEFLVFRQMKWKDLMKTLDESVMIMGVIFIIIAMATILNYYLILQDIPVMLVDWMQAKIDSRVGFLLCTLALLLFVGLFMDAISAILILAPLLLPAAEVYAVDHLHLGIIFIVGLEVGYLTPPVGINLFVASGLFQKSFVTVAKASLPYILCLLVGLVVIAFVPEISLWLTK